MNNNFDLTTTLYQTPDYSDVYELCNPTFVKELTVPYTTMGETLAFDLGDFPEAISDVEITATFTGDITTPDRYVSVMLGTAPLFDLTTDTEYYITGAYRCNRVSDSLVLPANAFNEDYSTGSFTIAAQDTVQLGCAMTNNGYDEDNDKATLRISYSVQCPVCDVSEEITLPYTSTGEDLVFNFGNLPLPNSSHVELVTVYQGDMDVSATKSVGVKVGSQLLAHIYGGDRYIEGNSMCLRLTGSFQISSFSRTVTLTPDGLDATACEDSLATVRMSYTGYCTAVEPDPVDVYPTPDPATAPSIPPPETAPCAPVVEEIVLPYTTVGETMVFDFGELSNAASDVEVFAEFAGDLASQDSYADVYFESTRLLELGKGNQNMCSALSDTATVSAANRMNQANFKITIDPRTISISSPDCESKATVRISYTPVCEPDEGGDSTGGGNTGGDSGLGLTETRVDPPTSGPTSGPTTGPTGGPTAVPTSGPTSNPTSAQTYPPPTPIPTDGPTSPPTSGPTSSPTAEVCDPNFAKQLTVPVTEKGETLAFDFGDFPEAISDVEISATYQGDITLPDRYVSVMFGAAPLFDLSMDTEHGSFGSFDCTIVSDSMVLPASTFNVDYSSDSITIATQDTVNLGCTTEETVLNQATVRISYTQDCTAEEIASEPTSGPTSGPTIGSTQPGGDSAGESAGDDPNFTGMNNEHDESDGLSDPTSAPTSAPTSGPTSEPTSGPTSVPTATPTSGPTTGPTNGPTTTPTSGPTTGPSSKPTGELEQPRDPTAGPTSGPTTDPTSGPTKEPEEPRDPTSSTESTPTGTGGDPHFTTWANEHYEYHGQCDLTLVKDAAFAQGVGLDIQIRTKVVRYWSYIKSVAIKIGNDILEIEGSSDADDAEAHYWMNYEYQGELDTFAGFPVTQKVPSIYKRQYIIQLNPTASIVVQLYKEFIRVKFNGDQSIFGNAVGLLGDYKTGQLLARDGATVLDDFTEFGDEWQVLPSEPKLFHEISHPQFPELCIKPEDPRGDRKRRLEESTISVEDAEKACASALKDPLSVKDCVYDILATQDLDMVGAF